MTHDGPTDLMLDDLTPDDATRVRLIERTCKWLLDQTYPTKHFEQAAVDLTARLRGLKGPAGRAVSAKTLTRLYYRYKAAGCRWQSLLDGRSSTANRRKARTANKAFRAHLALLATRHKRCLASAVRELYEEWENCKPIPGYEGLNYEPGIPLPSGWSMDNLLRLMPDRKALSIVTQGVRAAANDLRQAYGTRAGGWPCSYVMFDDVWLNILATGYGEDGKMQLGRPLQLGCLDYYTGRRLCWGTKIRTKREDGTSVQLNADEMLFLLCDFLHNVGYSPRGTVLVVEHGTAAISEAVKDQLALLTNGLVRVERSGMQGVRQAGAFPGRAVGNPRFKASIEVWHSLLHNYMDGYATQTGTNRTEPEPLWGLREECNDLLKKGGQLAPERDLALMPYAPSLRELADDLTRLVGQINNRSDHELEGWEACGFTRLEFSLNGRDGWAPLDSLDPQAAAMAKAMALGNPALLRTRRLSPQEAWELSLRDPVNKLIRLSAAECVTLMGAHRKFKLTMRGGAFKIKDSSRHHEQLLYDACVTDARGNERILPAGGTYFGVLNPFNCNLFILDDRDRVLGEAPLIHRFSHTDEAARLREFGRVQHLRAQQLASAELLAAPDTAAMQTRRDYNKRIIDGEPFDPLGLSDAETLQAPSKRSARQRQTKYVPLPEPEGMGLPDSYDSTFFNP